MRYAIVTETYPPEINGVALTVQSLEYGLRERDHTVDLIRPRQPNDLDPTQSAHLVRGVPLPRYPGLRFGLPAARRLKRIWRQNRPDAIYVATEGPLGWSALRAARALHIPAATGFHTRFDHYMRDYGVPFLEPVALGWMRHFHNSADATLVPTEELRSALDGMGFDSVIRLPRAVDNTLFDPAKRDESLRAMWDMQPEDLAVIHLGRIAPEKNLTLAVRAFRELQKDNPRARFIWVGDGPARAALARDNPDFIFCGLQRGEALARHFASCDLFLFPSRSETYGNVTLEAMASGVPTVAFDYGAAHEWLHDGIDGAAVTDGTHGNDNFIRAAVRIAADPTLRACMRIAARDTISDLHPQQVSADFDAILQRLTHKRTDHARHLPAPPAAHE